MLIKFFNLCMLLILYVYKNFKFHPFIKILNLLPWMTGKLIPIFLFLPIKFITRNAVIIAVQRFPTALLKILLRQQIIADLLTA